MTKKMPNIELLLHNRSQVQWSKLRLSVKCSKTNPMCTSRRGGGSGNFTLI